MKLAKRNLVPQITQGGTMSFVVSLKSIRSLCPVIKYSHLMTAIVAAILLMTSACAQRPTTPAASSTGIDTKAALQPYLGKWRPTSYQEGLNIGSLTISVDGLSIETCSSLTYELVKQTDEGVIVRVTGRKPANAFPGLKALAFLVETETVTGPPPAGVTRTRELLWICYLSGSLDRLASGIKKTCGNIYTR